MNSLKTGNLRRKLNVGSVHFCQPHSLGFTHHCLRQTHARQTCSMDRSLRRTAARRVWNVSSELCSDCSSLGSSEELSSTSSGSPSEEVAPTLARARVKNRVDIHLMAGCSRSSPPLRKRRCGYGKDECASQFILCSQRGRMLSRVGCSRGGSRSLDDTEHSGVHRAAVEKPINDCRSVTESSQEGPRLCWATPKMASPRAEFVLASRDVIDCLA